MSEPPAPPPPFYPAISSGPPPGGPRIKTGEWLNEAWQIIQRNWLEYVLAVLVGELVFLAGLCVCVLPGILVAGPMLAGVHIYLAKRLLGLPAAMGDVFKGFRHFGATLLLGVTLALPPVAVLLLFAIPIVAANVGAEHAGPFRDVAHSLAGISSCIGCVGLPLFLFVYPILVGTFVIFALPLILFRNLGAFDAIRQSIEIVKPQVADFGLLLLVHVLLLWAASLAGGFLVCVGFLFLSPLATSLVYTMQLLAYRDYVGLSAADLAPYAS